MDISKPKGGVVKMTATVRGPDGKVKGTFDLVGRTISPEGESQESTPGALLEQVPDSKEPPC